MSESAPTAEVVVDLVAVKPKRKPRSTGENRSPAAVDGFDGEAVVAVLEAAPKPVRARRSKVPATSKRVLTDAAADAAACAAADAAADAVAERTALETTLDIDVGTDVLLIAELMPSSIAMSASTGEIAMLAEAPIETRVEASFNASLEALLNASSNSSVKSPINSSAEVSLLLGEANPVKAASTKNCSPDQLTLSGAIRAGRLTPLPELGSEATIRLDQPASAAAPVEPDPYCALVLTLPSGLIEVSDGVRLLTVLTGIDLGYSAIELPHTQWLHSAVIGRLRATPFCDVIAITRGCLPPDVNALPLLLTVSSQLHRLSMQVRASTPCWLDLLTRSGWLRAQMPLDGFDALPLILPLLLASHSMPHMALAGLAAGDIVLPDTTWFDCSGIGWLQWRGQQLRVQFSAPSAITILETGSTMQELDIQNDDLIIDAGAQHLPLGSTENFDGIPVQLQFEMGRCRTTLGQLRTLVPGTVLPLDGGSPTAIAIVANGRRMGTGELVDVNGQLGIRIALWA